MTVDELAQEIRRVDGSHSLGAGALAEALLPFILSRLDKAEAGWRRDVGILLANIRQIEDATGEGPEGEDAQILDQIEREYEALPPPPSES